MIKGIRLSAIREKFMHLPLISEQIGVDSDITGINTVEDCETGDLVFVSNKTYLEMAYQRQPAALVVSENLVSDAVKNERWGILVASNVKLAHALIKQAYGNRDFKDAQWERIHPSAVIHHTVSIPDSAFIGPNVVIGQNTKLGEHCRLLAGVVIENDVEIGSDCIFHPNCVIGYNCKIGNEVEIGSGTVVGSEGYGFAQDQNSKSHKIPQTGHVVIEDRVLLGACNTIDRATYGQTRIGAGTKTDNIVHIAHNVDIGEDCLFTPMLSIAGSSKFGDRCITSGQTEVSDHMTICNDVVLFHRAGVTKNINEPGMYAGLPTQPLNQYMKNTAHFRKLNELNKKVVALEKTIKKLSGE
ncbi:MAG: UDP-3-O-(3-hydroxymyristoyl)glucosamine N-acyltransferase [Gammaproteobacteria bacterium]|nr:UDP-3-O-(3-hydroxymyristoyl)glucosamine N-acyltransferase [Gammaproteobacteria bacterium]